jgi:PII-like signaling protein
MKRYLGSKKVMRIYIDNADTIDGKPLWQYLVHQAKAEGLAGATVFKGVAGMGAHSQVHTFEIWSLAQTLPVIIEIIDEEHRITAYLKKYDEAIHEGLITLNDVQVIRYKHSRFDGEG